MIQAKVIADSINDNNRLTTVQLTYPRFIHSEVMTHRVFSRNAASSRAIPVEKMIAQVRDNPAMPIYWGLNKPGMQAGAEIVDVERAKLVWIAAANDAANRANQMMVLGLHKQVANRTLEPYQWMTLLSQPQTGTISLNYASTRMHSQKSTNLPSVFGRR